MGKWSGGPNDRQLLRRPELSGALVSSLVFPGMDPILIEVIRRSIFPRRRVCRKFGSVALSVVTACQVVSQLVIGTVLVNVT